MIEATWPTGSPRWLLAECSAAELALEIAVDHVVQQRALSRAGHAGDRGERAERNVDVDVAQIVQRGARAPGAIAVRPAGARSGTAIRFSPAEVLAGERVAALRHRSGVDDVAALLAAPGAQLHHEIGLPDGAQVVLHDEHGVARVAQPPEQRRAGGRCPGGAVRSDGSSST